jgi:methionyl-tRNA synthetase
MPHDPDHVLYVWIDALSNYITALGYGAEQAGAERRELRDQSAAPDPSPLFHKYWPADLHLIGKEILWFHAVYWPAMLISLGLDLPRQLFAHGWWTAEGEKMGKTAKNFIDLAKLRTVIATYGLDTLRYYLLRAAPFGNDLDWKDTELAAAHTELANVLGNCLNRVLNITNKNRDAALPAAAELTDLDRTLIDATATLPAAVTAAYDRVELQQAALLPIELVRTTNGYIDATAPWKLAKDPAQSQRLDTVLNLTTQAIHTALVALLPILPEKSAAGLAQLGVDPTNKTLSDLFATPLSPGHKVNQGTPLFPRVEAPK